MDEAERKLLKDTARTVLRLANEVQERLDCLESGLRALYHSNGNGKIALARLHLERELLTLSGNKLKYLSAFIDSFSGINENP